MSFDLLQPHRDFRGQFFEGVTRNQIRRSRSRHRIRREAHPEVGRPLVVQQKRNHVGPLRVLRIPDHVRHRPVCVVPLFVDVSLPVLVDFDDAVAGHVEHVIRTVGILQDAFEDAFGAERARRVADFSSDFHRHRNKIAGVGRRRAPAVVRGGLELPHVLVVVRIAAAAEDDAFLGGERKSLRAVLQHFQACDFSVFVSQDFRNLVVQQNRDVVFVCKALELAYKLVAEAQLALRVFRENGPTPDAFVLRQMVLIIHLRLAGPVDVLDAGDDAVILQIIDCSRRVVVVRFDEPVRIVGQTELFVFGIVAARE